MVVFIIVVVSRVIYVRIKDNKVLNDIYKNISNKYNIMRMNVIFCLMVENM